MHSQMIKAIFYNFPQFDTIEIYGLCDLHIGSREFIRREFEGVVKEILQQDNRFCVLLGDIIDNGLENSKTSPYSQNMQPHEQIDEAIRLLKPLADAHRILGATDGNHEQRTSKLADVDITKSLLEKLRIDDIYRPGICPIMVKMGERMNHRIQTPIYSIGVTHGAGGGTTLGAGLTKAESFALANGFDALIVGHSHKPSTAPSMRFHTDYNHQCMVSRVIRIMVCTGWLEYGGYPITKEYKPVAIKPSKLILFANEYDMSVLG